MLSGAGSSEAQIVCSRSIPSPWSVEIFAILPLRMTIGTGPGDLNWAGLKIVVLTCNLLNMPELPDIAAYLTALEPRIVGQPIVKIRLASPFLLRTAQPPVTGVEGPSCANCAESANESPSE